MWSGPEVSISAPVPHRVFVTALQRAVCMCSHGRMSPCRLGACSLRCSEAPPERRDSRQRCKSGLISLSPQTCGKRYGGNKSSAAQMHLHSHCWAGGGRWANKAAVFARHRVTASKDTTHSTAMEVIPSLMVPRRVINSFNLETEVSLPTI